MKPLTFYVTIRRSAEGHEFADMDGVSADPRIARQKAETAAATIPQWAEVNPIVDVRPATVGSDRPKPKAVPGPIDLADLSIAQLYAHYKRTAIDEDLKFFLRLTLSPELRSRAESIAKPTAKDLVSLRGAWRAERQTYEREEGIPAIGSTRWADYYQILKDAEDDAQAICDAEAEGMAS